MSLFTVFFVALTVSMLAVPPLMRVSGVLALVDEPGPRKVHAKGIPRSGGIAIVLGAVVPIAIWLPDDAQIHSMLLGGLVIFAFGLLDDRTELNYKWKFLGQAIAAGVAIQGGLLIEFVPFFNGEVLPWWLSYPVTAVFLLGVTNAINLSDGLDGLAGGTALITLAAIAWLAADVRGFDVALVALAVMGGICGFLRYNNHPAVVFMGDTGSQFLGFMTGALAILLTQDVFTALPHSLILLLLGMPILDTLVVMVWRIRSGRSPFTADKSHFHHRLLGFGFHHYEAVSAIYVAQASLVGLALLVRFQDDWLIILLYGAFSAAVIGFFRWARLSGWRIHVDDDERGERRRDFLRQYEWLPVVSAHVVQYGVALFLLAGAFAPKVVSPGHAGISAGIAGLILLTPMLPAAARENLLRLAVYTASVSAVYGFVQPSTDVFSAEWLVNGYIMAIAGVLLLAIRLSRRDEFRTTPLDLLILFFVVLVVAVTIFSDNAFAAYNPGETAVRLAVLFYASEFLFSKGRPYIRALPILALVAMSLLAVRAL